MSKYGLPYMGSKSKIADEICKTFPKADHFYDLFGGGFSISHCMLEARSKDFNHFHYNEIRNGLAELIKDSISGKYNYNNFKPTWVTREDFFANKETDIYKKIVWSFGNEGGSYIFGKDIEKQKESLHNAIIFNQFDSFAKEIFGFDSFRDGYGILDKRLFLKRRLEHLKKGRLDLQQLEQLERLQQLQQLERLQQLHFYTGDYRSVKIENNSVIYCDIPYEKTASYGDDFSHKDFYYWISNIDMPVFVSEYSCSDKNMILIKSINVRSTLAGGAGCKKVEKLFCNKKALEKITLRKL